MEAQKNQTGIHTNPAEPDVELDKPVFGGTATELAGFLGGTIYEQPDAVEAVVQAHRRMETGLTQPGKPYASLLFLGPTGVGKTELAKLWAKFLGWEFIRFDMSEFAEPHTVSAFLGSPAGYVGHGKPSRLSEINKHPHTVVLLDEVEKAHEDVLKIFLQAMDNGVVTDRMDLKIDFRNTVIIMTTNAACRVRTRLGFANEEASSDKEFRERAELVGQLTEWFLPEFLGRLTSLVQFHSLSTSGMTRVLDKKVTEINALRGLKERGLTLQLGPGAKEQIIKLALSEGLGARPVAHRLDSEVVAAMAVLMTEGFLAKDVSGKVVADYRGTQWVFETPEGLRPREPSEGPTIDFSTIESSGQSRDKDTEVNDQSEFKVPKMPDRIAMRGRPENPFTIEKLERKGLITRGLEKWPKKRGALVSLLSRLSLVGRRKRSWTLPRAPWKPYHLIEFYHRGARVIVFRSAAMTKILMIVGGYFVEVTETSMRKDRTGPDDYEDYNDYSPGLLGVYVARPYDQWGDVILHTWVLQPHLDVIGSSDIPKLTAAVASSLDKLPQNERDIVEMAASLVAEHDQKERQEPGLI